MSLVYAVCGNPTCGQEVVHEPRYDAKNKIMTTTQFCCRKCWSDVRVSHKIAVNPEKAVEARVAKAAARVDRLFAKHFGEMSEREREIGRYGIRVGYQRCYQAGRR